MPSFKNKDGFIAHVATTTLLKMLIIVRFINRKEGN